MFTSESKQTNLKVFLLALRTHVVNDGDDDSLLCLPVSEKQTEVSPDEIFSFPGSLVPGPILHLLIKMYMMRGFLTCRFFFAHNTTSS